MATYIHDRTNWTDFVWDSDPIMSRLAEARHLQGRLLGTMATLGFVEQVEASLEMLTLDVVKSSEIEGETLAREQVRSSIARRLGIDIAGAIPSERNVDGVVEMLLDATQRFDQPLTKERLYGWHAALFPTGYSHRTKITVADWRQEANGPMQVVSGAMGKERVHFQAPDASRVSAEIDRFLVWFNEAQEIDLVLKAGIGHFWFVTIHPFDDGNGRIARAIVDLVLARSDRSVRRFYSMSAQIRVERKQYYQNLEVAQKETSDITAWLLWFIECLIQAISTAQETMAGVLRKAAFWQAHVHVTLNERQRKILNRLFDGFDGKLSTSKWAKMNKCSGDTALRDIQDLIEKSILQKELGGGRSTSYELVFQ